MVSCRFSLEFHGFPMKNSMESAHLILLSQNICVPPVPCRRAASIAEARAQIFDAARAIAVPVPMVLDTLW